VRCHPPKLPSGLLPRRPRHPKAPGADPSSVRAPPQPPRLQTPEVSARAGLSPATASAPSRREWMDRPRRGVRRNGRPRAITSIGTAVMIPTANKRSDGFAAPSDPPRASTRPYADNEEISALAHGLPQARRGLLLRRPLADLLSSLVRYAKVGSDTLRGVPTRPWYDPAPPTRGPAMAFEICCGLGEPSGGRRPRSRRRQGYATSCSADRRGRGLPSKSGSTKTQNRRSTRCSKSFMTPRPSAYGDSLYDSVPGSFKRRDCSLLKIETGA
jgi:hypothetical protein